jgi:hypothetical protein
MPCIKCSNGKYKYGEHGNCQFDTLAACKQAAAALHIEESKMKNPAMTPVADPLGKLPSNIDVNKPVVQRSMDGEGDMPQPCDWHDPQCQCVMCNVYKPM